MRGTKRAIATMFGIATLVVAAPAGADTFNGAGTGPIADAPVQGGTCGIPGPATDVTFNVTGMDAAPPVDVQVSMTFSPAHTWGSDVIVELIAPGGAPSHTIFGRRTITTATACSIPGAGSGSDLAGAYIFADSAPTAPTFWSLVATPLAAGTYRSSTPGGAPTGGQNTLITPAYAGVADPNGTWTLRFTDVGAFDTGTVSAATLTLEDTDVTPPAAPALTATDPASPNVSTTPKVKGTAEASATVRLYSTANCSGAPIGTGPAADLAGAGITATVPAGATTQIRGTATDAADNTSPCSAPLAYTQSSGGGADTTAPTVTITKKSKAKTMSKTATFDFSANEPATFACKLTGKKVAKELGEFKACGSPQIYKKLKPGKKTFTVRATDSAGNVGAEASYAWKVKKKRR